MPWFRRLTNAVAQERATRDIERETAFHINELVEELMATGMSEGNARAEAHRRFGNPPRLNERTREVDFARRLEAFVSDVRYALRGLRRSPGFTAVAILSLALGIGANTAIFTVTNALALRSLPVRDPGSLLQVTMGKNGEDFTNPLWEQIRAESTVFAGSLAFSSTQFVLSQGGEERRTAGHWVSGGFFTVLGVRAEAGRTLLASDDTRGCSPVLAVGDAFARREFGSPEAALGRTVSISGHPVPVVGVIDPSFTGLDVGRAADIYIPLCALPIVTDRPQILDQRSRWYLEIVGRLKPGVGAVEANARLATIAPGVFEATVPQGWAANDEAQYRQNTLTSAPAGGGLSDLRTTYQGALFTLMVIVGVVLLIACTNLAQLLLARAAARQREIAIRLAIGVGRARLVRQLLTESLLLALGGAALGILFAAWASRTLVSFISNAARPIWLDLSLDWTVLAFTVGVATLTGVIFGLAPAWRASRVDPQTAMKSGGRGVAAGRVPHRIARPLVVTQVALTLMLVTGGALLLGSFRRIVTLDPGFRREGILLATLDFGRMQLESPAIVTTSNDVLRRIREAPGVTQASGALRTPASGFGWNDFVAAPGMPARTRDDSLVYFNQVSDGFFALMGTHVLRGRDISQDDIRGARKVAVVSELTGRRLYGDADPVGRTFQVPNGRTLSAPYEIVGVVADSKYDRLTETARATAFYPLGIGDTPFPQLTYEVRTNGSQAAVVEQIRRIAAEVSPSIGLSFTTLEDQVSNSIARPRLLAALSGFFGALAMLLAVIGLYGAMAYSVAQRRSEIGVRMALGAARSGIVAMVGREAAGIVGLGVAIGAAASYASTRVLSGFLFGLTATDPTIFALSASLLLGAGLMASAVPAWRAAGVDPTEALREE